MTPLLILFVILGILLAMLWALVYPPPRHRARRPIEEVRKEIRELRRAINRAGAPTPADQRRMGALWKEYMRKARR